MRKMEPQTRRFQLALLFLLLTLSGLSVFASKKSEIFLGKKLEMMSSEIRLRGGATKSPQSDGYRESESTFVTEPAQSGGNFSITRSVVASGGASAGGTYSAMGAIGQSVVGFASGSGFSVSSGYWRGVACAAIAIAPASLPAGRNGQPYNQVLTANGGASPHSFTIASGSLPNNLTLSSTGVISGTIVQSGTFNFTVKAVDKNGCVGELPYSLVTGCAPMTVTPPTLPPGVVGVSYNQQLTVIGGVSPYSFSLVSGPSLPPGLSLSSAGLVSGTPTTADSHGFTVRATDANGCTVERPYLLVINKPACPNIAINPTNFTLPIGTIGLPYNQNFSGAGGAAPHSFSIAAGALPAGLSLGANGNLSGTPAAAGNYNVFVRAADTNGCLGQRGYRLVIVANPVTSVSAASFAANNSLAPEAIVAAFGSDMAASTQIGSTVPLPTDLAGVSLKVKDITGTERLAPLFFVSPTQINYQIPSGTLAGPADLIVTNGATVAAEGAVEIANVSPGLFSADASGRGMASAVALRVKLDGTQAYEPIVRYDPAQSRFVAIPIDLSPATDQVFVLFYGTGWRFRSTLTAVRCSIGGVSSEVFYAGEVSGLAGLDQINVRLPRSLAGRGEVDVVIMADNDTANTVRIAIR